MKTFFFKDKLLVLFVLIVLANSSLFALQKGTLHSRVHSIEAILYGVNLNVYSYKGEAISYEAEIEGGGKVAIVEDAYLVRFRNSHPVKGTINVFVPEGMKIESLRIYASSAKVNVQNITAVYFVSSMCEGDVELKEAMLKCASFSLASGSLKLNGEITSTCDFCFAETKSEIALKGELASYNFFYPYEMDSTLTVDGKVYAKDEKFEFDKNKRKRIEITQTLSKTSLSFQK